MKKLASLITVVLSIACGRVTERPQTAQPQQTQQQPAAQQQQAPAPSTGTAAAAETSQKQTAAPQARAQFDEDIVGEVKAAFAGYDDSWVASARGSGPACELAVRFVKMNRAIRLLNENDITWEQANVSEANATKVHKDAGLAYAKELVKVLALPYSGRKDMVCDLSGVFGAGSDNSNLNLTNTDVVGGEIIFALKTVRAKPEDIGVSGNEIHDKVVLKGFVNEIASLRSELRAANDDGKPAVELKLVNTLLRAKQDWNYTDEQLQLTAEDKTLLANHENRR